MDKVGKRMNERQLKELPILLLTFNDYQQWQHDKHGSITMTTIITRYIIN